MHVWLPTDWTTFQHCADGPCTRSPVAPKPVARKPVARKPDVQVVVHPSGHTQGKETTRGLVPLSLAGGPRPSSVLDRRPKAPQPLRVRRTQDSSGAIRWRVGIPQRSPPVSARVARRCRAWTRQGVLSPQVPLQQLGRRTQTQHPLSLRRALRGLCTGAPSRLQSSACATSPPPPRRPLPGSLGVTRSPKPLGWSRGFCVVRPVNTSAHRSQGRQRPLPSL